MSGGGYLVQYGRSAFVGRFGADGLDLARGERVVVRTPRGLELGEVLGPADDRFAAGLDAAAGGDLVRSATPDDLAAAADCEALALTLLAESEAAGLPIAFVDAEVALDGTAAVLHALPWGPCDADLLFADLSARFGLAVRLLDASRTPTVPDPPEKTYSCGKPDCGSGGCSSCGTGGGCSTGGCSRGSVKSADELTSYFADLRRKMEQAAGRTPLH